jgi:hypothetical protein
MTPFENKLARIYISVGGLFFAAITISALLLRFEIPPFYELSLKYYEYEKVIYPVILVPAMLSYMCFSKLDKYKG